jgi:superfamily I DNA and RNA helicase
LYSPNFLSNQTIRKAAAGRLLCYLDIRGKRVILDYELAKLYEVETKALKQAVRRNIDRFPEDFMFELSQEEWHNLRTQFATSSWGGKRFPPFAFTEQGGRKRIGF